MALCLRTPRSRDDKPDRGNGTTLRCLAAVELDDVGVVVRGSSTDTRRVSVGFGVLQDLERELERGRVGGAALGIEGVRAYLRFVVRARPRWTALAHRGHWPLWR